MQPEPRGTADAVAAAEVFAAGDPFLVINSDNYYPVEALAGPAHERARAVALFEQEHARRQQHPRGAAAAVRRGRIDEQRLAARMIEKPDEADVAALPRPLWVSMNCWRFTPAIFEACRTIGPRPRRAGDARRRAVRHRRAGRAVSRAARSARPCWT